MEGHAPFIQVVTEFRKWMKPLRGVNSTCSFVGGLLLSFKAEWLRSSAALRSAGIPCYNRNILMEFKTWTIGPFSWPIWIRKEGFLTDKREDGIVFFTEMTTLIVRLRRSFLGTEVATCPHHSEVKACLGDFQPFARRGIRRKRGMRFASAFHSILPINRSKLLFSKELIREDLTFHYFDFRAWEYRLAVMLWGKWIGEEIAAILD